MFRSSVKGNESMRLTTALLAGAIFSAGSATAFALEASQSKQSAESASSAQTAEPAAVTWKADSKLQVELLKEITSRRRLSRDDDERRLFDELGTLYAAGFQGPVWIENDAPNKRTEEALDEFRRADEWALNPADYAFELPAYRLENTAEKARFEIDFTLNVLKYVDHARHGRFRPTEMSLWYERANDSNSHLALLKQLAQSHDIGALLVAQHPTHEGFKRLRQAYLNRKFPERFAAPRRIAEKKPKQIYLDYGSSIRRGQRDPQIALLRKRLKVPASASDDADLYDRELMNSVNSFMKTQGWRRKYVYDNKVRRALNENNGSSKTQKSQTVSIDDIVANMEKWRWLPRDLGELYIWNNLPSFQTQVVKNGNVIHQERIIIGKTDTQTPVFSDTMTHVIFKPQWGIPNSIKIKSLLPRLAGGDLDVLRRRGMQIQFDNNKVVSPSRYNWSKTDIRSIPIVMGAGPSNPLGRVKFMFPNHHAVYMHDTPDKHLFKNSKRTFSHGCIRVRNPLQLAEVLLGEASNWSKDMVDDQVQSRAPENDRIDLERKIQVHNVYFTVMVADNGEFETLPDIYGHDRRIKQALAGKSLKLIAQSDPARLQKREMEDISNNRPTYIASNNREPQPSPGFFGSSQYQYGLGGPGYYEPTYQKPKKYKKKKSTYSAFQINPYAPYSPFRGD